jgi:hypothetical protein
MKPFVYVLQSDECLDTMFMSLPAVCRKLLTSVRAITEGSIVIASMLVDNRIPVIVLTLVRNSCEPMLTSLLLDVET